MWHLPARSGIPCSLARMKSSNSIRSTFIEYFVEEHGHKYVKSSPVVPLCDPTVPFVNAGMHQFKPIFLGQIDPPCPRAVNSQKCIRVGGKHNDLEVVGTDGTHHTFFEMLGNWSFGDYYKREACKMAWDLLLGPYRLKPEDLVVTYFEGDPLLNVLEDRECRDIWRDIGVAPSRLHSLGAKDNFWEMGSTGPCGPCTEIHHVNADGSLTEIWNIVFIQFNREGDGTIRPLTQQYVDTGMGLERMAALLQGASSNYDTDLFKPIIHTIEQHSKGVPKYEGSYEKDAILDAAYRRLADHARMISICLADGVFPATSLNLKQIMRKSFQISSDIFRNADLVQYLYTSVLSSLGSTYPELVAKEKDAKLIIEHEGQAYVKLRSQMAKKWKDLVKKCPEVEALSDVEIASFAQGYMEFKQATKSLSRKEIPGEVAFKLYDTHGFQEHVIQRIADLNDMTIDKRGFEKLLANHRQRHKTSFKEQHQNRGVLFNQTIDKLIKSGHRNTNDSHKYNYEVINGDVTFKPLKTKLIAILSEDCEWLDFSDPCENKPYYLVTKDTNFYCEEGGQIHDTGEIKLSKNVSMNVETVFKIKDFVFHKGTFKLDKTSDNNYIKNNVDVTLCIDSGKRLNVMRNHTGVHLLNAALRKVLKNSVVCQIGSGVSEKRLYLNLSVYGGKLSQKVIREAEELVRDCIAQDAAISTRIVDSVQFSKEQDVVTVPGETYPDTELRLVTVHHDIASKELCCGTHVRCARQLRDFCVTLVKGQASHTPTVHALTGDRANEARELFCRAEKLRQVNDLIAPARRKEEVDNIKKVLSEVCGSGGVPVGEYAHALETLEEVARAKGLEDNDQALLSIAEAEIKEALASPESCKRQFTVHFLRCSYLMQVSSLTRAVSTGGPTPALLLGCAGGEVIAAATVPKEYVRAGFTATKWLAVAAAELRAHIQPGQSDTRALTTPIKVSLINCEQLVQDAMRAADQYAKRNLNSKDQTTDRDHTQNRQQFN